jgi:carboxymethylenebutenolidase
MAGTEVQFDSNGGTAKGYLATPASGSGPGIVVIQEWWGLTNQIRGVADRLAARGYVALAPDLWRGKVATEPDEAGKLMMALNVDLAAKDLRGAAQYLGQQPAVGTRPIGVIGFCMGGQLALYAATVAPQIAAVVNCYGIHPNVKPDFGKTRAPVLGVFGGKDAFVPAEVITALDKQLDDAGIEHAFHTYPDADHAFLNEHNPHYEQSRAEDAWGKIDAFLDRHLKSG